ncbi:MAG: LysM peptidoglycan-binding domain-containing protein, partial [Treponemataceae bacterium]|nr:LysM peptidoglycan-binding domain-containing protein [Treponemataceae bacterium]
MGEDDSIDAATAVFDADAYSSDELELCYSTYRVKKGDMIGFIADSFDVTQDTIISVNNIHQSRLIQPGQYLKIPSMPGILYTVKTGGETVDSIAEKYEVSAEKCARVNSLKAAEPLA